MSGIPKRSLRTVAVFEAAKGALVLLAGFGAMALVGHDLQKIAEKLVRASHLNPAAHYPKIFLELAARTPDSHLWWLAGGAAVYSLVRFVEAYGLWRDHNWASWLGALSGALYLPLELRGMFHKLTALNTSVFVVNLLIVALLTANLWRQRRKG